MFKFIEYVAAGMGICTVVLFVIILILSEETVSIIRAIKSK
jgi:hypothetical protein